MPLHELPVFHRDEDVPEDTKARNDAIIKMMEEGPDHWDFTREQVRQARREGKGVFPLEPFVETAQTIEIDGSAGSIPLRVIHPETGDPKGCFLHIHGGGWVYGNADLQDQRLLELSNATGLTCISVEYRLAPEHPYPAGPDDCEAAALWLANYKGDQLNTDFLAIGGESAGAHLAVNALLRLRDKHGLNAFHAAILIAGCFDLGMTPSAANFKSNLVLRHMDMVKFSACFLQNEENRRDPDISPLYATLNDLPPAHFSIGTADPLLDDSLFMAKRWRQDQSETELDVYPGACHVFQYFPDLVQSRQSAAAISRFLNRQMEAQKSS